MPGLGTHGAVIEGPAASSRMQQSCFHGMQSERCQNAVFQYGLWLWQVGKKNTAAFPCCSPHCKIRAVPCRGTKIHGRTLFDEIPCPQQTGIGEAWKASSAANNMHRISEYIRTESIYPACQMKPFVPTCPRSGSINKGS